MTTRSPLPPGDLQRLLGARGAAAVRSPGAGISEARSGRGPGRRLPAPAQTRRPRRDPPWPRLPRPGLGRPDGGGRGAQGAGEAQEEADSAPGTPPARLPGALPGPSPASPRPLLLVPVRTPAGGPKLPPQAEAAAALPGPAPDTSPMLSLPLKQRARKQAPRGNARPRRSKRNCPRAVPVPSRPPRAYGGHLSPAPAPDRSSRARVPGWERMDGAE